MSNKKINWGEELKTAGRAGISGVGKFFQILANVLITILLIIALTGILVVCAFSVYINNYVETEIDVELFKMDNVTGSTTTHIYRVEYDTLLDRINRNGTIVEMDSEADKQLQGEVDQTYVTLDKIPDNMVNAIIAIEDKRFMTHSGVDWRRTVGAGLTFFTGGGYGGSSITQQLIKNVTGEDDYSIQRKIQEIFWALDLETKMDKEEIIELYLNIVNFGHGSNGVQAAAHNYFSKDASELTLIECAAIACITKNPSYYDPVYYPEHNAKRRNVVLYEMYEQGLITYREYDEARNQELVLNVPGSDAPDTDEDTSGVNSWYADMVIEDVIDDLMEKYNYSEKMAAILVYNGGLNIVSLVDPDIQKVLEDAFLDDSNFPEDKSGIKAQCSAIVIDPYTGDVLGVVGARGEKTANRIQNFATMTKRPPGSAIKPLSVYAPAFEKGLLTWSTVMEDTPHSYPGNKAWPKNSYNLYAGYVNAKYVIRRSTNTTAVKMVEKVGLQNAFDFCYDTLNMKSMIEYGELSDGTPYTDVGLASLALGQLNYGVTVREITAAYSIFVNSGIYSKPNSYLKVTDANGNVLLENGYEGTVAISEETASLMTMLLESVPRTGGTASALTFDSKYDIDVAGKTGSAGDYYDRWFIGFTPYYLCGVWYGYEYPKSISASSNPCLKVWDAVMGKIHEDQVIAKMQPGDKYLEFNVSNNLVQCTFCRDSGLLMSEVCSHDPRGDRSETGWFIKGTEPTEYCDTHIMVDYDYVEKSIACEWCPPENITQVALIKVDRKFPINVAVYDAQYGYMELPFDVMPYSTVYYPYYFNLGGKDYYVGYTYGYVQYNKTCLKHFDRQAWKDKVAEIIAGANTTAPLPETTVTPSGLSISPENLFTFTKKYKW
ncbi:MAG: transglycosylase domain-containing protein [Eubacteriales bacterium]